MKFYFKSFLLAQVLIILCSTSLFGAFKRYVPSQKQTRSDVSSKPFELRMPISITVKYNNNLDRNPESSSAENEIRIEIDRSKTIRDLRWKIQEIIAQQNIDGIRLLFWQAHLETFLGERIDTDPNKKLSELNLGDLSEIWVAIGQNPWESIKQDFNIDIGSDQGYFFISLHPDATIKDLFDQLTLLFSQDILYDTGYIYVKKPGDTFENTIIPVLELLREAPNTKLENIFESKRVHLLLMKLIQPSTTLTIPQYGYPIGIKLTFQSEKFTVGQLKQAITQIINKTSSQNLKIELILGDKCITEGDDVEFKSIKDYAKIKYLVQ